MATSPTTDEKLLDGFRREFAEAESFQKKLVAKWDSYHKAYLGEAAAKNAKKDSWRSRLYVKHLFQQIQTLLVEVTRYDTELDYIPRTPADEELRDLNEKIIDSQLYIDRWDEKKLDAAINTLVYGGQPVKIVPEFQKCMRKMPAPSGNAGEYVLVPYVEKNQPTAVLVDPERLYADPTATTFDTCRYVFEELFKTTEELQSLASVKDEQGTPVWKNLDQLPDRKEQKRTGLGGKISKLIGREDAQKPDGNRVLQRYKKGRLTVVVNDEIVIRDEQHMYWHGQIPFVMMVVQRDPKNLYGISEVWSSKDIQEAIWTLQNAQYDALRIAIQPPLVLRQDSAGLMNKQFKPGQTYTDPDPATAVMPLRLQNVENFTSEAAVQALVSLMERMTGANSSLIGMSQSGSATESAGNLEQSKGRIGLKNKTLDFSVARIVEFFRELNRQFLTPTEAYRLVGPDGVKFVEVTRQHLDADYEIRPKGGADRATKQLRRQNAQDLMNTLMPLSGAPLPDGRVVNPEPAIRKMLQAFDVPDVEAFFASPPPPPADQGPVPKVIETMAFKDLPPQSQQMILAQTGLLPPPPQQGPPMPPPPDASGQMPMMPPQGAAVA